MQIGDNKYQIHAVIPDWYPVRKYPVRSTAEAAQNDLDMLAARMGWL
jgi:hypothetical protein